LDPPRNRHRRPSDTRTKNDLRFRKPFSAQQYQRLKFAVLQMCCIEGYSKLSVANVSQTTNDRLAPQSGRSWRYFCVCGSCASTSSLCRLRSVGGVVCGRATKAARTAKHQGPTISGVPRISPFVLHLNLSDPLQTSIQITSPSVVPSIASFSSCEIQIPDFTGAPTSVIQISCWVDR